MNRGGGVGGGVTKCDRLMDYKITNCGQQCYKVRQVLDYKV